MAELELPNGWWPRPYQMPLWRYLEDGGDRAAVVWHRRAGKDAVAVNHAAAAGTERRGNYWHMLPTAQQGRKVIWESINKEGRRVIDQAFPPLAYEGTGKREDEMLIRLRWGSTYQVLGSDNYNALIGSNPVHITFSEYAVADPAAWNYLRPILLENKGTALFIFTPRGMNHGYHLYKSAEKAGWFTQTLTVDDTGVFTKEQLERERRELIEENGEEVGEMLFQQEYYCSFQAAVIGSYWGAEIVKAEKEKRITRVPYDPTLPVHTIWDLGMDDAMSIWFCQVVGPARCFIDYYEASGQTFGHYANVLREKGYSYGEHYWPHDGRVRDLSAPDQINGEIVAAPQRREVAEGLGIRPIKIVANLPLDEGIKQGRALIATSWFDAEKCAEGLDALRQFRREWDDERKIFLSKPVHDWTSHAAASYRYAGIAIPTISRFGKAKAKKIEYGHQGVI